MKILYFECAMGAAGDMLASSLLGLIADPEKMTDVLNEIGIPNTKYEIEPAENLGISGLRLRVSVSGGEEGNHAHSHHTGLSDIISVIDNLNVSQRVKSDAKAVYGILASAESKVHGKPVDLIHFHEIGALDAVADIVAVCSLIERIAPDYIAASPICTGFGQVHSAHGLLPVPAPATAEILKDVPIYGGSIEGELCTPTGAALLKYFAGDFIPMPQMRLFGIGYGIGKKDFKTAPNCVRAFLGDSGDVANDKITELACNIDDMTGEALSFAADVLREAGALDVSMIPIQMKKGRPGSMLVCLCRPEEANKFAKLILKYTTTFGVRRNDCPRYILCRTTEVKGEVRIKTGSGYGIIKAKPEYEDLADLARERGCGIDELR